MRYQRLWPRGPHRATRRLRELLEGPHDLRAEPIRQLELEQRAVLDRRSRAIARLPAQRPERHARPRIARRERARLLERAHRTSDVALVVAKQPEIVPRAGVGHGGDRALELRDRLGVLAPRDQRL